MSYITHTISLSRVRPGPFQHRENFDRAEMSTLAASIRAHGLLSPPVVDQAGDDYPLIAGERRWRALYVVHLAGQGALTWDQALDVVSAPDARRQMAALADHLAAIKIEVRLPAGAGSRQVLAAIENGQRQNLNPIEEANDYQGLLDDGYSVAEVADLVGKSAATIETTVRLLRLEPEVKALLIAGDLSKTHGTALATVKDRAAQIGLANRAVKRRMTVTTLETACQSYNRQAKASPNAATPPVPAVTVPLKQIKAVHLYQPPPFRRLSPDAAEYILALAEESCNGCLEHGFSAKCLTCEGFAEFATRLIRAATYAIR